MDSAQVRGLQKDECGLSVLGSASKVTVVTLEAMAGMPHQKWIPCEQWV